jgi:hypothetical protein
MSGEDREVAIPGSPKIGSGCYTSNISSSGPSTSCLANETLKHTNNI